MTSKTLILFCFILFRVCPMFAQHVDVAVFTTKDGLAQNAVRSIVKDKYGFMWFGTWNGLCRYDGYQIQTYRTIDGDTCSLPNNRIHRLYKDAAGNLWVSTFNYHVCRYNYESDNFTRFRRSDLAPEIEKGTERVTGLSILDSIPANMQERVGDFKLSNTGEHLIVENSKLALSDNNVNCLYADSSNVLWIGTAAGGINKIDFNAKAFLMHRLSGGGLKVNMNPVRAVSVDSAGIWLGTQNNGLVRVSGFDWAKQKVVDVAKGKNVRAICRDSRGILWLACRDGLYRYQSKRNKLEPCSLDSRQQKDRFSSIAENPFDGSVWFGAYNGIWRFDSKTARFEEQKNLISRNANVVSLFFDKQNNLWIGTEYAGVIVLKQKVSASLPSDTIRVNTQTKGTALPDNRVYSITGDQQGKIWIGTANGLCSYELESGNMETISLKDGLADQYLTKLIIDQSGYLWASHKKGISRVDTNTRHIQNYTVSHSGYEFVEGAGCLNPFTGELLFGGVDGCVSFRPEQIVDNPHFPKVVHTNLEILNRSIGTGDTINNRVVLQKPLYLTDKLTLTNRDRSFSIEFAALNYSNPEKNKYAYKLEGYDEDWIYTSANRRIASYSNMPAGEYRFQVKASNNDGVWTPVPASLQIVIREPWWKTPFAYMVYVLAFSLVIYIIYRLVKMRHQYNHELLTARLNAQNARQMEQLKAGFFTNISHEVRTPLSLLIDPLERLVADKVPDNERHYFYRIMHKNASRLLTLVNQLLDYRKIESGSYMLEPQRGDVFAFVRNCLEAFELEAKEKQLDYRFECAQERLEFVFDPDIVAKLMNNLISNALKYTPADGKVSVSLSSVGENEIQLIVSDTGTGFDESLKDKLFEPFFQEKKDRANSSGIGLALTRELVAIHGGRIEASSIPNVETHFTVHLKSLTLEEKSDSESSPETTPRVETLEETVGIGSSNDKPLVLVVEDNQDVREYLEFTLREYYKVQTAANGLEGLQTAFDEVPDLVISDIDMPEMNGLDLCRTLKTDQRTSHIPVILLTAMRSGETIVSGYETGADDYITKPFQSTVLFARIKNLLELRRNLRNLFGKDFNFDPEKVVVNSTDKAFVAKAVSLVTDNLMNPEFGVDQLASLLNMSRTPLYRKIKSLTGQTVHEFIATIRLNKAAELLLSTDQSISEISWQTGFSTPGNFSRSFSKQFGQSPSGYQANYKSSHSK